VWALSDQPRSNPDDMLRKSISFEEVLPMPSSFLQKRHAGLFSRNTPRKSFASKTLREAEGVEAREWARLGKDRRKVEEEAAAAEETRRTHRCRGCHAGVVCMCPLFGVHRFCAS